MRKIFLATTALVAVTGVASADSHADIAISGTSSFNYVMSDNDENERDMNTQVDVEIKMNHPLENGMELHGLYVMDEAIAGGPSDYGFSIETDPVTFGFASMANDGFAATSNGVTKDEGNNLYEAHYPVNEVYDDYIPSSDVSFVTKNIGGFMFGLGMTDGDTDANDGSQLGVQYTADVSETMSVVLGYAKHSSGDDGGDASSTGATVNVDKLSVKLATNVTTKDDIQYTGNSIAATYAVTDNLSVQAYTGNIDNDAEDAYEVKDTAFGLTYTVTPGMMVSVTHNEYTGETGDEKQAHDGRRTAIALDVTF